MRYFFLIFLMSCTHPLKFKYTSGSRYLSSLTSDDIKVARIEGALKNDPLFVSGMDSTALIVKLYDENGELLTAVDPADLTLSTSEDLEAKPFVLKQGVYKAELLPRLKSKNILMRVDWMDKVFSQDIILKTTTTPVSDELIPLHHEYSESRLMGEVTVTRGSAWPVTSTEGFEFENVGDNRIVNGKRHLHSQRAFSFDYASQARQNIALQVDDAPSQTVSQTMHSIFMFFPRKYLPMVQQAEETLTVTVSNGEKIVFQKDSKEIIAGIFTEGPVDVTKDRTKRKYADLKYQGKGVILRVNSRGQSPQLGGNEAQKIDMEYGLEGSADVLIINGTTGQKCRRPKSDFWEPLDVSPIVFKFATDQAFEKYLLQHCGFGLPKF